MLYLSDPCDQFAGLKSVSSFSYFMFEKLFVRYLGRTKQA